MGAVAARAAAVRVAVAVVPCLEAEAAARAAVATVVATEAVTPVAARAVAETVAETAEAETAEAALVAAVGLVAVGWAEEALAVGTTGLEVVTAAVSWRCLAAGGRACAHPVSRSRARRCLATSGSQRRQWAAAAHLGQWQ